MKLIGHLGLPPFWPKDKWFEVLALRSWTFEGDDVHAVTIKQKGTVQDVILDDEDFLTIECVSDDTFDQYVKEGIIE